MMLYFRGPTRRQSVKREFFPFCSLLLCLIPIAAAFTINRDPSGPNKQASPFVVRSSPSPNQRDLELLIQAATSDSNGYAIGGDFAGLAATFNPADGSFIPIPEHLIPQSLIEWGQEPKCLEILVSEEFNGETMIRNTITVLPDTGCSIDNLETIKVKDEIDVSFILGEDSSMVGLQYPINDDDIRLETIFGMDDNLRMRVVLDLSPSDSVFVVQSPMVLALERKTSSSSSSGVIADGGGLDGRTVSMLLGEQLRRAKTFVEDEPLDGYYESDGLKRISFPGNVGIAYGWLVDKWVLQISHVEHNTRRVVSRVFHVADDQEELDFDIDSWEEDITTF